jgi:hypothetical protein
MKKFIHLVLIASFSMMFSGCFFAIGSSPDTVIQNNPYSNQPHMTTPYYNDGMGGY